MSFNLIDRPWLPCVVNTGQTHELSLRDVFARADELRELRAGSPLVTVSLHRLLLAITHRVLGPADTKTWSALWEAKTLPVTPLNDYLSDWHDRFDLLHDTKPFYQVAGFSARNPSGMHRLVHELSQGNNATLFDHTADADPPAIPLAQAARLVVTQQAFAIGGGKSDTGYLSHAPLVGGTSVLPLGRTLRETLLLNLVTYDGVDRPFPAGADAPFWERDRSAEPPLEQLPRHPAGLLDLLTWQTRTLRLHPESRDGQTVVRRVSYAQGRRFDPPPGFREPSFAIARDKIKGDRPIRISEARALWRDSAALVRFAAADEFVGPLPLEELAKRRLEVDGLPAVCPIALIGMCTDKAKVCFWRHERLPLPLAYLADRDLVEDLKTAIAMAERVAVVLWQSVNASARAALSPADPEKADKNRTSDLVDSLAPERLYWARLEEPFRHLLVDLPGTPAERLQTLGDWFAQTLRPLARNAFDQTAGELDASARAHRAAVFGESVLFRGLASLRTCNDFRHALSPPEASQSTSQEVANAVE